MPCGSEPLHLAPRETITASRGHHRLLRKTERFAWTPEAEEALGNLKTLLTNAPILVPPAAGEALLIYVAATTQVVSAAIVVERQEEGHALPV
jgi:hypothetical protein